MSLTLVCGGLGTPTAEFTPPRSGTFIYHAHANETFQVNLGLYGALPRGCSGSW